MAIWVASARYNQNSEYIPAEFVLGLVIISSQHGRVPLTNLNSFQFSNLKRSWTETENCLLDRPSSFRVKMGSKIRSV